MKVLLVNKYYYRRGGAEAHVLDLQRLLETRGHRTLVFSMQHQLNEPTPFARYFVSSVDYHSRRRLHRARAGLRLVYSLEARSRIRRLLDAETPDVAHVHNIYHQLTPSILPVMGERRLPVVFTMHDLKLVCPSYLMFAHGRPCERCLGGHFYQAALTACHQGSRIRSSWLALEAYLHKFLRSYQNHVQVYLCPSRFHRDKLVQAGFPADAVQVLPYFLDAKAYQPQYGGGEGLVYFGRLSPEKGIKTLIEAVASRPGIRLTVVGDGPLRGELERRAAPVSDRVVFTGRLSGGALHDAVRSARVCVLPSECYENCPVSVLESFALGRPVIASNIGGLPELVTPGQTGWLFAPGRPESLLEAIESALKARNLEEMGRECRRRIEIDYSPEQFYERLSDVYRRARVKLQDTNR